MNHLKHYHPDLPLHCRLCCDPTSEDSVQHLFVHCFITKLLLHKLNTLLLLNHLPINPSATHLLNIFPSTNSKLTALNSILIHSIYLQRNYASFSSTLLSSNKHVTAIWSSFISILISLKTTRKSSFLHFIQIK